MGFWGFRLTQMNSVVPGTHLGVVICPKPLFPNSESFRVLVGVKDKVSPPRLPGNVRFGRRIGANRDSAQGVRRGSSVTISALRV